MHLCSNFLLLSSLPLVFLLAAAEDPSNGTTVYDLLPKFGLPPGLLPDTVRSYSLAEDGSFVVELQAPCYVQFDYLVYYDQTITGTLKVGGIQDLQGIEVQKFFVWLDVDAIKVDLPPNEYIYFEVGWITKKLPVEQFSTVRSCTDGVSLRGRCGGVKSGRFNFKIPEPVMEMAMLITE